MIPKCIILSLKEADCILTSTILPTTPAHIDLFSYNNQPNLNLCASLWNFVSFEPSHPY